MIGTLKDLVAIIGDEETAEAVLEAYLLIERETLPEVDEGHRSGSDYIYVDQTTTYVGNGVSTGSILSDIEKDLALLDWIADKSAQAEKSIEEEPERVIKAAKMLFKQDEYYKAGNISWENADGTAHLKFIDLAKMFLKELDA